MVFLFLYLDDQGLLLILQSLLIGWQLSILQQFQMESCQPRLKDKKKALMMEEKRISRRWY
jgi:hypothetical protein